jgi:segregation and condensation protein B
LERHLLKSVVEGLIFAHAEPVSAKALADVIQTVPADEIQAVIDELEQEYLKRSRGFILYNVAGGYQFRSLPHVAPWILESKKLKPAKLSRAALETLAIIAYNQPVTRGRIEKIRGVESSATVKHLIERELVEVVGRKDIPGRPLLYATSPRFLEVFGLPDLASLPPLPELEAVENEVVPEENDTDAESAPSTNTLPQE